MVLSALLAGLYQAGNGVEHAVPSCEASHHLYRPLSLRRTSAAFKNTHVQDITTSSLTDTISVFGKALPKLSSRIRGSQNHGKMKVCKAHIYECSKKAFKNGAYLRSVMVAQVHPRIAHHKREHPQQRALYCLRAGPDALAGLAGGRWSIRWCNYRLH